MRLIEITNQQRLDDFTAIHGGDFLQSWSWGEFQKLIGAQVIRLAVEGDDENLLAVATLIKRPLIANNYYWFCPRGIVLKSQVQNDKFQTVFDFFLEELKIRAHQERVIFLRLEPPVLSNNSEYYFYQEAMAIHHAQRTLDLEPSQTAILDLTQGVSEILQQMHQKTRYNIRLAEKKGVEVFVADNKNFNDWWQILQETGGRDGFRLHGKKYYEQMMALDMMTLYLARHDNKILAGILVARFGHTATYVHGASSNDGRHLMAPYLLQWEAIKTAQVDNFNYYDFYGVDKVKWPGVTRFKDGFSGQNLVYLGTFDLVFNKGYYKLYQVLRNLIRTINKLKGKI